MEKKNGLSAGSVAWIGNGSGRKATLRYRDSLDTCVNKNIPWVIEGLLAEGEQMLVFGAPKVGKSQLVMQMAVSLALDKPFHCWVPGERKRKVLYVNLEIGERAFMRRLAEHVLAEVCENRKPNSDAPIPDDLMKTVDERIKGRFYFTQDIRHIGISREHIEGLLNASSEPGEQHEALLREWHEVMDTVEPDLVVFDTLSKVHTLDERENNAIQGVLMLIRRMVTITPEIEGGPRKEVAHVVVHHARKQSENGFSPKRLSLDAIRGGSAIRAEADVILGLQGVEPPAVEAEPVARTISIEARNIAGGNFEFRFDGFRFQTQTEETKASDHERYRKQILEAFTKKGVRGIATGELVCILANNKNPRSAEYERQKVRLREFAEAGDDLIALPKKGNEGLIAEWPVFPVKSHAAELFWIRDGSSWLDHLSNEAGVAKLKAVDGAANGGTTGKPRRKRKGKGPDIGDGVASSVLKGKGGRTKEEVEAANGTGSKKSGTADDGNQRTKKGKDSA